MAKSLLTLCIAIVCTASAAHGANQEPPLDDEQIAEKGLAQVAGLGAAISKMGEWEYQYPSIERAINHMWEKNNWESEPDQFARELMLEVSAIPPWEFSRRTETAIDQVAARYKMTPSQRATFQSQFYLRAGKLLFKNRAMLFKQIREVTTLRTTGKPISPDQVSQWINESDDFMAMARSEFDGMVQAVSQSFTPEQKQLLEKDMQSYRQRVKATNELREAWRRGEWSAEDWGLDNDPIQTGTNPVERARHVQILRASANRAHRQRLAESYYLPSDESTWERYVRRFITQYQLNEGQAESCLSILREMKLRARAYSIAHGDELESIPKTARPYSPAFERIRELFNELKRRLDTIPTDHQRRQVEETAGK